MLRMLPALPMLRMLPALPILKIEPALPMLRILPALKRLPTLKKLPTLRMLPALKTLPGLRALLMPTDPLDQAPPTGSPLCSGPSIPLGFLIFTVLLLRCIGQIGSTHLSIDPGLDYEVKAEFTATLSTFVSALGGENEWLDNVEGGVAALGADKGFEGDAAEER